jgi:hypothetical protein
MLTYWDAPHPNRDGFHQIYWAGAVYDSGIGAPGALSIYTSRGERAFKASITLVPWSSWRVVREATVGIMLGVIFVFTFLFERANISGMGH